MRIYLSMQVHIWNEFQYSKRKKMYAMQIFEWHETHIFLSIKWVFEIKPKKNILLTIIYATNDKLYLATFGYFTQIVFSLDITIWPVCMCRSPIAFFFQIKPFSYYMRLVPCTCYVYFWPNRAIYAREKGNVSLFVIVKKKDGKRKISKS